MPLTTRVPPGRAARMWLRRRIDTATRGRDQLDHRLRILRTEQQRARIRAERFQADWAASYEAAGTWLLRAVVISGEDAVRHASPATSLTIRIRESATMGVTYPTDVAVLSAPPAPDAPEDNAAIGRAAAAYRTAALAAARAAAAEESLRVFEAEISRTRRRLRALDKRWLPWLRDQLMALDLALEQQEQEDGVRLRRAVTEDESRRQP